jgi:hypothetical protein
MSQTQHGNSKDAQTIVRFLALTPWRLGVCNLLLVPVLVFGCGSSHTGSAGDAKARISRPSPIAGVSVPTMPADPDSEARAPLFGTIATYHPGVTSVRQEPSVALPKTLAKVQAVVNLILNTLAYFDGATAFWLAIVITMLVFHTFEDRSTFFSLGFAMACWSGSACAFLQGERAFGVLGGIWGLAAMGKAWKRRQTRHAAAAKGELPAIIWPARFTYMLAVIAAFVLLIADSPFPRHVTIPLNHAIIEAAPLLLVGIAFFAWLTIDRPGMIDLIKQALIATAFVLWGVSLLMPSGRWAIFVGAVVIAIYVFDLAWLMEGNLRKMIASGCTSPLCKFAGICCCDRADVFAPAGRGEERRPKRRMGARDN